MWAASLKVARLGWAACCFPHGPEILIINFAELIKVIVFLVAMVIIIIIHNGILNRGNNEFLCVIRRLLGRPGLHPAIPYPLLLVS